MAERLPAFLTVVEAGVLLRVGRTKAYAMAREWRQSGGRSGLPVVDFGHVLRVPLQALEELISTELGRPSGAVAVQEANNATGCKVEPTPSTPENPTQPPTVEPDHPVRTDTPHYLTTTNPLSRS